MFIRRKLNKSGTFSVQVLVKRDGRNILLRSFGASKDEDELRSMELESYEYICRYGGRGVLAFEDELPEEVAERFFNRIVDIRQDAPRIILSRVYDGIGFNEIPDNILRSLAIARVCEPKSKVATVEYLKRCFREDYQLHQIYFSLNKSFWVTRCQSQEVDLFSLYLHHIWNAT